LELGGQGTLNLFVGRLPLGADQFVEWVFLLSGWTKPERRGTKLLEKFEQNNYKNKLIYMN